MLESKDKDLCMKDLGYLDEECEIILQAVEKQQKLKQRQLQELVLVTTVHFFACIPSNFISCLLLSHVLKFL